MPFVGKPYHKNNNSVLEVHILTEDIFINLFEIGLYYNLNRGSINSPNPQKEISVSHKKMKRFYLHDDSEGRT